MSAAAEAALAEAVAALRAGEVVGLPTETVYGIGVDPSLPDATDRLFAVKRRPESAPLPVLVASPQEADSLAFLDERARRLIAAYWPGPLTLVLRRRPEVSFRLGGDEGTIGLRCPDQPLTRRLLGLTGPLAVTSANLHGGAPATTPQELREALGGSVRVVLDDGRCAGTPSSVLSLVGAEPQLLREGALPARQLLES